MDLLLIRALARPIRLQSRSLIGSTRMLISENKCTPSNVGGTPCFGITHYDLQCSKRSLSSNTRGELTGQQLQSRSYQQQVTSVTNWDPNLVLPPYVDDHLSYAYGRSLKELRYHTFSPMLDAMAKREPHSTAVVVYDEGISRNFEELRSDVYKLVNGMVSNLGVKRGDKIGVYSYNNYQFLLIQLACLSLGCVLNPFNPSYKAHEFSYVLGKSDIKVLFTTGKNSRQTPLNDHHSVVCDESVKKLQGGGLLDQLTHIVLMDGDMAPSDLSLESVKVSRWSHVFTDNAQIGGDIQHTMEEVRSDDLYGVYYTSGTTGFPKGASISQFNALNNSVFAIERIFQQRESRQPLRPNICIPLPLFHEFAGILGVLAPFVNGGSIVLTGLRYNIQSVVESIMRFKCNAIFATPTILIDITAHIERNKLTLPLRTMLVAGSKVTSELFLKIHKLKTHMPDLEDVRIGYGSSENGVIASIQTCQEAHETRPLTVGPPLDFTEIRVVDPSTGDTTLLGQSGEVQTRGFNTMVGYYKDPERTDEVITKSRWYKTGDMGIIDHRGSLQIVGRIKELIIKGGENVYPAEIETVLHANKLIEDAHVFGVPDKRFGEEICVWIKLDKTKCDESKGEDELKKEIIDYCKQRLTYFKVPKYVMFVEEYPLTPVGKIKKFEMRAQATKILKL